MMLASNRGTLRLILGMLLIAAIPGCCSEPWDKFSMPTRPDRSCRTGSASGYDVHIWSCLNNQHVAIYKYSGEMSCAEPVKEAASCGELTPIEQQLGSEVAQGCESPPDAFRWP